MCAMVMVVTPRPCGQPKSCSIATNSSSSDSPVITSGITSGAVVIPDNSVRPLKRPKRASTRPASVPRITAPVALRLAILMLNFAALSICCSWNSSTYHLVEKPAHTVTSFEELKEKKTIDRIGTYRNANPNASMVSTKKERRCISGARPSVGPGNTGTP